eukprot:478263_1
MLIDHSNRMSAQGINHGILDVNQCNIEGGGATQCVRHLLSNHSVIINEATPTGASPLLIASSQGHDEIVEMLIDHSNRMSAQGINHGILDVNQCNIEGVTPL